MSRPGHIWKQLAFKSLFSIIGLILLTAQVSYKFYYSASMPVFRSSVQQHSCTGAIAAADNTATLSLDKRFDLKPSFALLTPVFRLQHYSGAASILPFFGAPGPDGNWPVFVPLRGPPPVISFS